MIADIETFLEKERRADALEFALADESFAICGEKSSCCFYIIKIDGGAAEISSKTFLYHHSKNKIRKHCTFDASGCNLFK